MDNADIVQLLIIDVQLQKIVPVRTGISENMHRSSELNREQNRRQGMERVGVQNLGRMKRGRLTIGTRTTYIKDVHPWQRLCLDICT